MELILVILAKFLLRPSVLGKTVDFLFNLNADNEEDKTESATWVALNDRVNPQNERPAMSLKPPSSPVTIPFVRCNGGKEKYKLHYKFSWNLKPKKLKITCGSEKEIDLFKAASDLTDRARIRVKNVTERMVKALQRVRNELPDDREKWKEVISNPKHPITASVLAALSLLAAEISGFGIFALLTTILGTMVLAPIGWAFIPLIVAIILAYRKQLEEEQLSELKKEINELDEMRESGGMNEDEYYEKRNEIVGSYFSE